MCTVIIILLISFLEEFLQSISCRTTCGGKAQLGCLSHLPGGQDDLILTGKVKSNLLSPLLLLLQKSKA